MKSKLLILNIVSYILMYHIVFESLIILYDFDEGRLFTPFGRLFREYFTEEYVNSEYLGSDFLFLTFNLFISSILIFVAHKWFLKDNNAFKSFLLVFGTYILINLILIIYVTIDNGMALFFVYFVYFLFPMSIMTMLIIPILWINHRILKTLFINKLIN